MIQHKKYLIGMALILTMACSKENEIAQIDSSLLPYFERFKEEANNRGITIDYNVLSIDASITSLQDENLKGRCIKDPDNRHTVLIDSDFWVASDDLSREFIVFHELGHCALGRSHFDDIGTDGRCLSIMYSGSPECRNNYTDSTRETYLDELFSQ